MCWETPLLKKRKEKKKERSSSSSTIGTNQNKRLHDISDALVELVTSVPIFCFLHLRISLWGKK